VLNINGKTIGNIKKGFDAACKRAGIESVTPHPEAYGGDMADAGGCPDMGRSGFPPHERENAD
jgi:hypothetical protein